MLINYNLYYTILIPRQVTQKDTSEQSLISIPTIFPLYFVVEIFVHINLNNCIDTIYKNKGSLYK